MCLYLDNLGIYINIKVGPKSDVTVMFAHQSRYLAPATIVLCGECCECCDGLTTNVSVVGGVIRDS